jgi:hypothetical protein
MPGGGSCDVAQACLQQNLLSHGIEVRKALSASCTVDSGLQGTGDISKESYAGFYAF